MTLQPDFDFDKYFDETSDAIIAKLMRPENNDLLFAVVNHMGQDDSFMFTFSKPHKLDFDTFVLLVHQTDALIRQLKPDAPEDLRSMSQRYDEHLAQEDKSAIDEGQTTRWNTLIEEFDNGWSGFAYGFLMRKVQFKLRRALSN